MVAWPREETWAFHQFNFDGLLYLPITVWFEFFAIYCGCHWRWLVSQILYKPAMCDQDRIILFLVTEVPKPFKSKICLQWLNHLWTIFIQFSCALCQTVKSSFLMRLIWILCSQRFFQICHFMLFEWLFFIRLRTRNVYWKRSTSSIRCSSISPWFGMFSFTHWKTSLFSANMRPEWLSHF